MNGSAFIPITISRRAPRPSAGMSQPDDRPLTLRRFLEKLFGRSAKGQGGEGGGSERDAQEEPSEGPRIVGYVAPGERRIRRVRDKKRRK